jgi:protein TonB
MPQPSPSFLSGHPITPGTPGRPMGRAVGSSLLIHGALVLLLMWGGFRAAQVVEEQKPINVVYLPDPGPGGGGGGNPGPLTPARPAIPKPSPPQPVPLVQPTSLPEPLPDPTLIASTATSLTDLIRSNSLGTVSLGIAGGGRGTGVGPGKGPGAGPGEGGNSGGGPMRPGNGCSLPDPIRQPHPNYTTGAMAAKIQGDVALEVVVRKDGTVGDVHVVRSLDPYQGLDAEAVRTAKAWTFRPATCAGSAVDMIVSIVLEFRLH